MISKQALGNILFGMADDLRDKVEDYKSYILTILFFKRLSDNYEWETQNKIDEFVKEYGKQPNDKQLLKIIEKAHDFLIPENSFWSDVRDAIPNKKNDVLHQAVTNIANTNPSLKGVINTVRWNEPSPDGSGGKKLSPSVLTALISRLDAVDLSNKNASVDILGDAYEYLIKKFADENKGGTTAGQFYTPQEVVDIIVRYTKPKKNEKIYDPTCGSGGLLINSAKYVKETLGNQKAIQLFGQEDVWNTWAICNINMILHGLDAQIKKDDTLLKPQFNDGKEISKFDLVLSNFPFSLTNWWKNGKPKMDKKGKAILTKEGAPQLTFPDKNEFTDPWDRFEYGIPPFSNGDFAFLQHIVASMNENGRAGVVCPQGVLFRGQPEKTEEEDGQNRKADDEYEIRRQFLTGLEDDNGNKLNSRNIIEAIVVLPSNLFYGTTIPGSILFLNKNKPADRKDKVLMIYAAREGWYKEEANMNTLQPHDILRIMTMLESWGNIETAQMFIPTQEVRLHKKIQEDLDFKLSEIEIKYKEDIELAQQKIDELLSNKPATKKEIEAFEKKESALEVFREKLYSGKTPTQKQIGTLKQKEEQLEQSRKVIIDGKPPTEKQLKELPNKQAALQKLLDKKNSEKADANAQAEKERGAIQTVKQELLEMYADPELRKRYFSIVDMDELEENEYNLNIPRYVDTFEPEEEIDLQEAIAEFNSFVDAEGTAGKSLLSIISRV